MLATGVMAGLGFFFWLLVAHLFDDAQVGLAATLISVMNMIAALSLIGFDTATIRFLAHSEDKNESINTGFSVISLAALTLSTGFVLLVDLLSPDLSFIADSATAILMFIVFSVFSSLNIYTDAIFLAHRKTKFTFWIDTAFSVVKVGLPFLFVPYGALGIFAAAAGAQALGFLLSLFALVSHFNYRPSLSLDTTILRRSWSYSAGNYIADVCNFLPLAVLPVVITNELGPDSAAHFYIVMMIAGLLYVIPQSTMRSLFAEGSFEEGHIAQLAQSSLRTTAAFLVPAMLTLIVFGELILALFGSKYASGGISFLYVMTLGGIAVTAFALYGALFRLTHNILSLIARNAVYAVSMFVLVYFLLPHGLLGVGIAYVSASVLASIVSHFLHHLQTWYLARPHHAGKAPQPFTLDGLSARTSHVLHERVIWPLKAWGDAHLARIRCLFNHTGTPKRVLCYPELPRWYHVLYKVAPRNCWQLHNDPSKLTDLAFYFKDTTVRQSLDATPVPHNMRILNATCLDISKRHVDEVMGQIFGYTMSIDPTTFKGRCVRKSDTNAVHDGTLIDCPTAREDGYVYQLYVDTATGDGRVYDLRIPIIGNAIPFVLKRYKSTEDMFDETIDIEFLETQDALNDDEQTKVLAFARAMGLDYGELDALRSNTDQKLYLVDVNSHPSGPIGPLYRDTVLLERWYHALADTMQREFVHHTTIH